MTKKLLPLLSAALIITPSLLSAMECTGEGLNLSNNQVNRAKALEEISKMAKSSKNLGTRIEVKTIDPIHDKAFVMNAIRQEHKTLIGDAGFDSIDDFNRMLTDINQILFIESERAGIISYSRTGHIYMLYIAPRFRGHGYGKLLLNAAKTSLATTGIKLITLQVFDYNHSGKDFFTRLGFLTQKNRGNLVTLSRAI